MQASLPAELTIPNIVVNWNDCTYAGCVTRVHTGRAALDAIASPARQELLLALSDGQASVRELAARLGRSRSALHYHARVLERAGMIKSVEERGTGRERETVYARVNALTVRTRDMRAEFDVAKRAGLATLRLTQRELVNALDDVRATGAVPRALFTARGKARLTPARLARATALIDELLALFTDTPTARGPTPKLYAVTIVLTPSRDASAPDQRRRKRIR